MLALWLVFRARIADGSKSFTETERERESCFWPLFVSTEHENGFSSLFARQGFVSRLSLRGGNEIFDLFDREFIVALCKGF